MGDVRCFWLEEVPGEEAKFRRADTGEICELATAQPGAMWDARWYRDNNPRDGFSFWNPVDGVNLMVKLPNGHDWYVDGRAANCDQPQRPHRCWIRHGDPRAGVVTVDKAGDTCGAGAGSIASGGWHGTLTDGWLRAC